MGHIQNWVTRQPTGFSQNTKGGNDCLSRDLAVTIQVENAERCPANVLTATYRGGDQLPSHLKGCQLA